MQEALLTKEDRWNRILRNYRQDSQVKQLIFVKYTGGTEALVSLYQKTSSGWDCLLSCPGYVGREGIGKIKEGDEKTPVGIFSLTSAFGIKDNPGARMDYVKIHPNLYWCGDEHAYNRLIDIRETPHECLGEHLIEFAPHYHYGFFTDFNRECVYGRGSAIFFHCSGPKPYTGGCVAVAEENMVFLLQRTEPGAKLCIFPA